MAPAASSIANVASIMKDKFGPSTDVIIAKTKEFYSLYNEFPALAERVIEATTNKAY
jgi:hypothetical protein